MGGVILRKFGIILVSHGDLAEALRGSLEMLVGAQQDFETVALRFGMGQEALLADLEQAAGRLSAHPKLLILADLVGGTPSNVALQLVARNPDVFLISGVNLAVLCELAMMEDVSDAALDKLVKFGRLGMRNEGARLRARIPSKAADDPADL